jgi:hypothetical protein
VEKKQLQEKRLQEIPKARMAEMVMEFKIKPKKRG